MNLEDELQQVLDSYAEIAIKEPAAIQRLELIYAKLFGETLQKECGTCYVKAFRKIQRKAFMQKNQIMKKTNQKYQLKEGILIDLRPGILSPETLTDEKSEALLAKFPHYAKYFDKLQEQAEETEEKAPQA